MAGTTLKQLIAKALLDPKFKKKLLTDFEGTAKAEGVRLTRSQLKAFGQIKKKDWDQIEKVIGDTLLASSACKSN